MSVGPSTNRKSDNVELHTDGHGSETVHKITYNDLDLAKSFKELISISKKTVTEMSGCQDACDLYDRTDE